MSPAQLPHIPLIVWLSFAVHGNEPSPSEVAMTLAHEILSKPEHTMLLSFYESHREAEAWGTQLVL